MSRVFKVAVVGMPKKHISELKKDLAIIRGRIIVRGIKEGLSISEIAKIVGLHYNTVYMWVKKLTADNPDAARRMKIGSRPKNVIIKTARGPKASFVNRKYEKKKPDKTSMPHLTLIKGGNKKWPEIKIYHSDVHIAA